MSDEPALLVLPNLEYECSRCHLFISHPDDPKIVRDVALRHNAVTHRSVEWYADVAVRWPGFIDRRIMDRLTDDLCKPGRDVWVDEFGMTYSLWEGDPEAELDEVLLVIGRYVGTELNVVELRGRSVGMATREEAWRQWRQ